MLIGVSNCRKIRQMPFSIFACASSLDWKRSRLKEKKKNSHVKKLTFRRFLSPGKLNGLSRGELLADAEEFGMTPVPLGQREAAQALSETDLIPSGNPNTVVLSEKGWIRAAKGADVNPRELNYRGDDGTFILLWAQQSDASLDRLDGRTYTMPAHTLPSARGMGSRSASS
ncbi:MAG: hypothetical protein Ct9H300mP14_12950 [Gammaproteobacteria bacterium]|nr:MAG: hypothetical protein Ct9H300mP14_12950 [Gammaproteobacteria bacterium]